MSQQCPSCNCLFIVNETTAYHALKKKLGQKYVDVTNVERRAPKLSNDEVVRKHESNREIKRDRKKE